MAASVVSVKQFTYKGSLEEWSNRYHFLGDPPDTVAGWIAIFDNIVSLERNMFDNGVTIVRTLGYESDVGPAAFTRTADFPGNHSAAGVVRAPGDCAFSIRYSTGRNDSRGHPVYLRNYYHAALFVPGAQDVVWAEQVAAANAFANRALTGWEDADGVLHRRCGPDGLGATGKLTLPFIGRRKLKRRG